MFLYYITLMHIYQVKSLLRHIHSCAILKEMFVGIDVGASYTRYALFKSNGDIATYKKATTSHDYQTFKSNLLTNIKSLLGNKDPSSIVIATQGRFDYRTNIIKSFGNIDWTNIPLQKELSINFSCPLLTENDCNVAAIGESILGVGKGYSTVLYLTLSTGIGGGVVKDGELVTALAPCEPGFMILPHNNQLIEWEEFAAGKAFVETYGKPAKDIKNIDVWKDYASRLVLGFAALLAIVQPDIVVVGGSVGAHLDKYKAFLIDELRQIKSHMWDIPPILTASDPENAVLNGCFVLAKQALNK